MSDSHSARSESAKSETSAKVANRRQELEHRLRNAPTDRDAYLELAAIYRDDQQPLHAARVLKQGHEVFPDDEKIHWELEEAQLKRSMQKLSEVRKLASEMKNSAADQEVERAETDWANCRIKICRGRLVRDRDAYHLRLILGEALYDLQKYEEAIEELEPLMDTDSHSAPAALWIGRSHLVLGRDVQAMRSLRAAALRRTVVGPVKIRIAALKMLIDMADRHGLTATLEHYQSTLTALSNQAATTS